MTMLLCQVKGEQKRVGFLREATITLQACGSGVSSNYCCTANTIIDISMALPFSEAQNVRSRT